MAAVRTTFTRMVTSTTTATVWFGVPAGGEYPNVKCKNRSPDVSANDDAYCVYDNGDIFYNRRGVDWGSYGNIIFQVKSALRSPDCSNIGGACNVYNDGWVSGGRAYNVSYGRNRISPLSGLHQHRRLRCVLCVR